MNFSSSLVSENNDSNDGRRDYWSLALEVENAGARTPKGKYNFQDKGVLSGEGERDMSVVSPRVSAGLSLIILLLAATPVFAEGESWEKVKAWEGTLTLPTYAWYDDPNPVFAELEGAIYYPYTRQDYIAKSKSDRVYKALFLEKEYLRVTCLPELAGRIYSVLDKTTQEEMFHKNDEIKPALIAMRGAWISGGIEWNVGPQGHSGTIVSPVDALLVENDDGSATLVVGNTEKMFRTRWTVRLTWHPGKAYLDETIRMFNPTDGTHPYYFWNCTAVPHLEGTRFIYPMTLGTDHAGNEFYSWPIDKGRDLSWLKNYNTMSSVFGYECVFDFFGAYDVDRDRGIVSYANHHELMGKKAWTWGKDDFGVVSQKALSDAGAVGAQYIEVQSGPLRTQADYGMLRPRQEVTWREFWYPAHGLGDGFEYATRDAVVQTSRRDAVLELRILATAEYPGAICTLSQNGEPLLTQPVDLSPRAAQTVRLESAPDGPISVSLCAKGGSVLLAYDTPLDIPEVNPPDLTKKPARADGQPTADEKYAAAFLADSQSNPAAARSGYEAALAIDPLHVPSLCSLATLDIEVGRFAEAAAHAEKATRRNPGSGEAWYLLGVAQLNLGEAQEAITCGYNAARALDHVALGYNLVGRARMRLGDYPAAVSAFARAQQANPLDTQNRDYWLIARYAAGERDSVAEEARMLISREDPTDFIPRALIALQSKEAMDTFAHDLETVCGERPFTLLEVAPFFAGAALYREARTLLESVAVTAPRIDSAAPPAGWDAGAPEHYHLALQAYYLAFYCHQTGDNPAAEHWLQQAAQMPCDYVFPSRIEALALLQYAVERQPEDTNAHLLLGCLYAGLLRLDDAVAHWRKTVELDAGRNVAWRLLGCHAWKKQNDLAEAERCYRKAIAACPGDQTLYRDLAAILAASNRRTEGIALIERMPRRMEPRFDAVLWLAEAYLAEARYDECVDLLKVSRFSNYEGSSRPQDLFARALTARGKQRYEAGELEAARKDFELALTYPENLEVGARYKLTDAEIRYWLGKTLLALGRPEEAQAAWEIGAAQVTSKGPQFPFIPVTPAQDEYVQRCATALEVMAIGE